MENVKIDIDIQNELSVKITIYPVMVVIFIIQSDSVILYQTSGLKYEQSLDHPV